MLKFPSDYSDTIAVGVRTLRRVGARLRADADRRPERSSLWLSVRDVEGLADRLDGMDDWEWRNGFADLLVTGQDVGVLDELVTAGTAVDGPRGKVSTEQAAALAPLRDLLRQYCDGDFEFDEPPA